MKVLVIGIDSLDPHLLDKFADDLPNLTRLRREHLIVQRIIDHAHDRLVVQRERH